MILSAPINANANGDNQVVAGVAGKRIRCIGYVLMAGGTVNATWKSSGGTLLSGAFPLVAQAGAAAPQGPVAPGGIQGWFESATGEDLTLNLSAGVQVSGHLVYQLVL